MSRPRSPAVASTHVMARTLATFFAFGGAAGILATLGAEPAPQRWVLLALSLVALACAAVAARWGTRWPRQAFHLPVAAATVLITTAILLCPDPVTALAAAAIISFVVADAHLFFSGAVAFVHLAFAVVSTTVALLVQDGIAVPTVLAFDLVLVGLGVVIQGLVARAASANRDPLTGLSNRRGFDAALQELMVAANRTGDPLAAVLFDLDHFKGINDTAGHEAGDRVLRRVADVWRSALPAGAVLARHGGDEFSLLLPGTSGSEALALVRRISALHPDIGLSVGVTSHLPGETASQLMRRADRALYEAKDAGRGRAVLDTGAPAASRSGGRSRR